MAKKDKQNPANSHDDDVLSRLEAAAQDSTDTGLDGLLDKTTPTDTEQELVPLTTVEPDEEEDKPTSDSIMEKLGFQKYGGLEGKTENLYINKKGLAILITLHGEIAVRFGYSLNNLQEFANEEIEKAKLRKMIKHIIIQYIDKESRKTTSYTFNPKNSVMPFEYSVEFEKVPDEQTIKGIEKQADKLKKEIYQYICGYLKEKIGQKDVKLAPAKIASDLLELKEKVEFKAYLKKEAN